MANKIKVTPFTFEKPEWSVATAKPGDEVELRVTTKDLADGQSVFFEVRDANGMLALLKAEKGGPGHTKKWVVPAAAGDVQIHFDAVLREVPSPKNAHLTVRRRVVSGNLAVQGYKVAITSIDPCFVPKQEKLEVKFKVTDAGAAAKSGRYEVWGERYPSDKPLYTKEFTPAAGDMKWDEWKGNAEDGTLSGKLVSPEFSPYRVRVVIGPDGDAVKDPLGKGKGKVSIAEAPFEVTFESMHIRLQAGLEAKVQTALDRALVIEPRAAKGGSLYPHKGRLPLETEPAVAAGWAPGEGPQAARPGVGRIRIDNRRFRIIGESLGQDVHDATPAGPSRTWEHGIADKYMKKNDTPPGGAGKTKFDLDKDVYSRPELPVEIELRLRSKTAAKNASPDFGVFEKEAVGPANVDVFAADVFDDTLYAGGGAHATYFLKAATRVKDGKHDTIVNDGTNPVITYWQERFKIAADGDQDITTTEAYVMGSKELTVYLNRTLLRLGADLDYTEVSNKKIKLKAGLTKAGDVVWVMRTPAAAPTTAVADWAAFPPGDNAHKHYGGLRGTRSNPNLLKKFSSKGAGSEPILGKGSKDFPYEKKVDLDPDGVGEAKSERVLAKALTAGDHQGLAGVIFSPSSIAGDSYRIEATLRACPFDRTLGFVETRDPAAQKAAGARKPWVEARSGVMTVWRFCSITNSRKMPAPGADGLPATAGFADPALAGRTDPGDGTNMNTSTLNQQSVDACIEWEVPVPSSPDAAGEPHKAVKLADYRKSHNGNSIKNPMGAGHFPLNANADVTDDFVQWDPYRVVLPANLPANRRNVVSNAIATVAKGATAATAMAAAQAAINAHEAAINPATGAAWGPARPDASLNGGVTAIPLTSAASGVTQQDYFDWADTQIDNFAKTHLDNLTPRILPPVSMSVMRWPNYSKDVWDDATPGAMGSNPITTAGFCRGSGQAFFATAPGAANPDTFEHEMGHSLHLTHFSTGRPRNSCWKHHDHGFNPCMMGYNGKSYTVPLPPGVLGGAIVIATGARGRFCAKCLLKMRGWNEVVLPSNWTHPSVF